MQHTLQMLLGMVSNHCKGVIGLKTFSTRIVVYNDTDRQTVTYKIIN